MSKLKSKFEKHESRLSTTDEHGNRVYVYPENVKGKWRNRRHIFYWSLILIYLILPWIYYQNQQLVLLDIANREFHFFGQVFYAHNTPLIVLVFIGFAMLIAFLTSLYGRVWCGYACPQTVFIDAIYLRIERLIEGNSLQREKLDQTPWNFKKIQLKTLKWFCFTLVSLHIAHSFIGYFVGTRELFWITLSPPWENWTLFLMTMGITALCLFDFGWFREQFCTIACPYGRFQSVLMDENTLTVSYDFQRGEPRRGLTTQDNEGDCVNCYQCVRVCPTGIDIRNGTQLECIGCTQCIDACDEIMSKLNRPSGLIRYASENQLKKIPQKKIQPRTIIYLFLLSLILATFIYLLKGQPKLDLVILNQGKSPYTELQGSAIRNQKLIKLTLNQKDPMAIKLRSHNPEIKITTPLSPWPLRQGINKAPLFLTFQKEQLSHQSVSIDLINNENQEVIQTIEVQLVGPRH